MYVGSSASLARRLGEYYSSPKLVKFAEIGNSIICKALLKYGHKNFKLEILCYCEPGNVLLLEQYFINSLKPEYNILQVAGSPLGHKHSDKTLATMRGPKSPEHLAKIRENLAKINIDRVFSEELRSKISKANGNKMAVTDTATGEIKEYPSMRALALEFGVSRYSLGNYIKSGKLFRGVYKI
jgi:group I intron endonuclease